MDPSYVRPIGSYSGMFLRLKLSTCRRWNKICEKLCGWQINQRGYILRDDRDIQWKWHRGLFVFVSARWWRCWLPRQLCLLLYSPMNCSSRSRLLRTWPFEPANMSCWSVKLLEGRVLRSTGATTESVSVGYGTLAVYIEWGLGVRRVTCHF